MNPQKRSLVLSAVLLAITTVNFSRLSGTECIRPIHIVSLLVMGALMGNIVVQVVQRFKNKN